MVSTNFEHDMVVSYTQKNFTTRGAVKIFLLPSMIRRIPVTCEGSTSHERRLLFKYLAAMTMTFYNSETCSYPSLLGGTGLAHTT